MADVHGGLLKCVLQLAACSDKLRSTDELLSKYVRGMQRDLPAADMPRLASRLAVVAANPDRDTRTREEKFQALLDQGTEAAERLEVAKSRHEKELRRRSEKFQQLVKSRNTDIQEEYARMLKELDDQTEELDQEIAQERAVKTARAKRRRDEAEARKADKKQRLEAEAAHAKAQLEEYTAQIRQLQQVFASLEEEDAALDADEQKSPDDAVSIEERRQQAEERAQNEINELQQEVAMLRDARDAIAEKIDVGSLKAQYTEEKQEIVEETTHLREVVKELTPQISSSGVRLHSLLRTLAPTPGIGTLMTRLYQQLSSESSAPDSDVEATTTTSSRKTVELRTFLNSCPSAEEGNRAIDELKKLQLIHCYESSGIIALAD